MRTRVAEGMAYLVSQVRWYIWHCHETRQGGGRGRREDPLVSPKNLLKYGLWTHHTAAEAGEFPNAGEKCLILFLHFPMGSSTLDWASSTIIF